MKALVIAGTGFAGGHLLRILEDNHPGIDLFATRRPGSPVADVDPMVMWFDCDVNDPENIRGVMERSMPDVVFHMAAKVTVENSWKQAEEILRTNVIGTRNVLESLVAVCPGASILVPGSAEVYGFVPLDKMPVKESQGRAPSNPYGLSKLYQEEMVVFYHRAFDVRAFTARPFHYTGPGQPASFVCSGIARQIAECEAGLRMEVLVGNLDAMRDFTDIRDVVTSYVTIVLKGKPGRPYNVCTGKARSIRSVLDTLRTMAKTRIEVRVDPAKMRKADVPLFSGNASRIRKEIGWSPGFRWEETLEDLLNHWREKTTEAQRSPGGGHS